MHKARAMTAYVCKVCTTTKDCHARSRSTVLGSSHIAEKSPCRFVPCTVYRCIQQHGACVVCMSMSRAAITVYKSIMLVWYLVLPLTAAHSVMEPRYKETHHLVAQE